MPTPQEPWRSEALDAPGTDDALAHLSVRAYEVVESTADGITVWTPLVHLFLDRASHLTWALAARPSLDEARGAVDDMLAGLARLRADVAAKHPWAATTDAQEKARSIAVHAAVGRFVSAESARQGRVENFAPYDPDDYDRWAKSVARARRSRKLTQATVAGAIEGLTPAMLSEIERSRLTPDAEIMKALCRILELRPPATYAPKAAIDWTGSPDHA
jgi:DNA-binding XRE family transcriptional regulator